MEHKNDYKEFDYFLRLAMIGDGYGKLRVVEMLRPLIISSIKKYCPVMREFEDLYADGVEVTLSLIETFDGKRSFLKYAKSYLKYHYLDTYKYLTNVESDMHEDEEVSIFDTIEADTDVEDEYLKKENKWTIREAIKTLTPREQQVINLFYYHRLGLSEIGNYLGISKWTVVNLKRNAITKLRKVLVKDF